MSVFKEFLHLWRSDDLLAQAWQESYEMLELSHEIFTQAITMLREHSNKDTLLALKKRDILINTYQQEVRRKVMTHFALNPENVDLASGLVLVNMVVDIERLGDYSKNILDLAIYYPRKIISEEISSDLSMIETEIIKRFQKTVEAIKTQDVEKARALHATYRHNVGKASDVFVNEILEGKKTYGKTVLTAAIVLYARYLKRVGAHLKNITSILINPFDTIGYKPEEQT